MTEMKKCSNCGIDKPVNKDFFGHTPNGNFRNECRECKKNYSKKYGAANRDSQRTRNDVRVERGGHIHLNDQQKMTLYTKQKGLCLCCGEKLPNYRNTEIDHANPIARGGANSEENLYLAHTQCNKEKHAKSLEEHWAWRELRGLLVHNKSLLIQLSSNQKAF